MRLIRIFVNWGIVITSPLWAIPFLFAAIAEDISDGDTRIWFGRRFFWE